MTELPNCTELI